MDWGQSESIIIYINLHTELWLGSSCVYSAIYSCFYAAWASRQCSDAKSSTQKHSLKDKLLFNFNAILLLPDKHCTCTSSRKFKSTSSSFDLSVWQTNKWSGEISVTVSKEQTVQSSFSQLPVRQFTSFHVLIRARILMSQHLWALHQYNLFSVSRVRQKCMTIFSNYVSTFPLWLSQSLKITGCRGACRHCDVVDDCRRRTLNQY